MKGVRLALDPHRTLSLCVDLLTVIGHAGGNNCSSTGQQHFARGADMVQIDATVLRPPEAPAVTLCRARAEPCQGAWVNTRVTGHVRLGVLLEIGRAVGL